MKVLPLIFALFFSMSSYAQLSDYLSSDRPGQANSANTLGKGVIQLQSGYNFINSRVRFRERVINTNNFNNVLRVGLGEKVDAILTTNYIFVKSLDKLPYPSDISLLYNYNALTYFSVGGRFNLINNINGANLGLQATVKLPILTKGFNPDFAAPKFELLFNLPIYKRLGVAINLATEHLGNNFKDVSIIYEFVHSYVFNLNYSYNNKIGVYAEIFGNINSKYAANSIIYDGGIYIIPHPNLQFDISVIYFEDDNNIAKGIDVGITYRLLSLRKNNNPI